MPVTNSTIKIQDALICRPQGQGSTMHDLPHDFEEHFRTTFNIASGCPAISAGYVPDPENFSRKTWTGGLIKVQGLPIKKFNDDSYSIPRELDALYGKTIAAIFQNQFDRNALAYHFKGAILWIDRSHMNIDECQRAPSWHVDRSDNLMKSQTGRALLHSEVLPSVQISPQVYVVSDFVTTQVQSSFVRDTEIFRDVDKNKPVTEGVVRNLDPYEIGLMTGDTWHRGRCAEEPGIRNFLSIMFVASEAMESAVQQGVFRQKEALSLNFD